MFHIDWLDAVSLHLELNFSSNEEEEEYDLFWDCPRIQMWDRGECTPIIKRTLLMVVGY